MAKIDSYLKFVVRAEYDEHTICAEPGVVNTFKKAYVEVFKLKPDEALLKKEFSETAEPLRDVYNFLRASLGEFVELPTLAIQTSRVKFLEKGTRKLGDILEKWKHSHLEGGFVISYNGRNITALLNNGSSFLWGHLRSCDNTRKIYGVTGLNTEYIPTSNRLYCLLQSLFEAVRTELL